MKIPFVPERASNFAPEMDALFYTLTALTVIFTVLVGALVLFFAIRYRKGSKAKRSGAVDSHLGLELTWTIIPLILGLFIFWWSAKLFIKTRQPPKDAMEIFVIGKQWMWHVQHANGVRENNEMHVPVGVPVRLTMISQDVIHSFFVPQFRIKQDVLPGRYSQQWFITTKPGKYNLFCAEYCGTEHSAMGGYVYALPKKEFDQWLASGGSKKQPPVSMIEAGQRLFEQNACGNCHGALDTPKGPSLVGLFGKRRTMRDGTEVDVDDSYLRESILNPYAKIVKGYLDTMPEYKKQLSEEQVLFLNAYIKSLGATQAPSPRTVMANTGNNK